ncbi:MAG TPA: Rod shape-determining protein MreD, partial [Cyclobacteriaceae bacterium]|nr:Rod shape-determining protein MreD [Cyclobacteriaceae bacterium]
LLGFTVDIFYDSMGLHALATVMMAYLRNYWLSAITPQGGYENNATATIAANGLQWFLVYSLPLVFLHHLVLFFVEASGFTMFWYTMLKIVASLLFTMSVIVLLQFLTPQRRRI